jgi:3-oxoacyl-[acyl-carrier protein] reductase
MTESILPGAGRTVVVTGASRGLGRHICQRAMDAGYGVIGVARNVEPMSGARMLSCDVSDAEQVANLFRELRKETDLWGLINAAGVASMNLVLTTPPETIERIIRVNLVGTIFCNQHAGRLLVRRRAGRIINFSTIAVSLALKGEATYAGSKAGVEAFSRSFAREMGDHNITVNCISPGPIDTALISKVPSEKIERIVERQILARKGTAEDVWNVASLLLSSSANMITGEVIHIGGA